MKWKLLSAIALLLSPSAWAATSCFANTTASESAQLTSPAINTTGATLLVAILGGYEAFPYVTDSAGNNWQYATYYGFAGPSNAGTTTITANVIAYVPNPITSSSHRFTITNTASAFYVSAVFLACSGTANTYVLGAINGSNGGTTTTFSPGSITPLEANDLVVTAASGNFSSATLSISSGFSTPITSVGTLSINTSASYEVASGTSTLTPTWTASTGTSWASSVVVFKASTASPPTSSGYNMSSAAGVTIQGFSGDGAAATSAELNWPSQIVLDSSGDVIFADNQNNRIRIINTQSTTKTLYNVSVCSGCIQTIAGNGTLGFSGDGGAATSAMLAHPVGMAIDSSGNVYVADQQNGRIREITTAGNITSPVGTGIVGSPGCGRYQGSVTTNGTAVTWVNGSQFWTNTYEGTTWVGAGIEINGVPYTISTVNSATSITLTTSAGVQSTAVGYYMINSTTLGDGGPATSAILFCPQGVAVDSAGNIYASDSNNYRIRAVNVQGTTQTLLGVSVCAGCIQTVAGNGANAYCCDNGPATSAEIGLPLGSGFDPSGNFYISTYGAFRIRKVTPSGTITTFAGNGTAGWTGDGGPATSAELNYVYDVKSDSHGNIFIADSENNVIREVNASTGIITTVAGDFPLYNIGGGYGGDNGYALLAGMQFPIGIAIAPTGVAYIGDLVNNRVRKLALNCPGICLVGIKLANGTKIH